MTDVVMPGRSGIEMVREVRRASPGQRVLFMSGYAARETGRPPDEPPQPFLPKPFSLQRLRDAVAAALDTPPAEIDGPS
jgi:DNA-binding NtrC family response regulator